MGKRKRSLGSIESTDRNKKENWNLQTSQTKENKQYEEYYKLQGVVCEEEMKEFMTTMVFAYFNELFIENGSPNYISY